MHLLVEMHTKKSGTKIVKEAKEKGVRVYDLKEYMILEAGCRIKTPTLLLGYGALSEDEMKQGILCLREIV